MPDITFRKGTPLAARCTRTDVGGNPASVADTEIRVPVWRPASNENIGVRAQLPAFEAEMTVAKTGTLGEFTIQADTSSWPEGTLYWRIEYTDGETVEMSPSDRNLTMLLTDAG